MAFSAGLLTTWRRQVATAVASKGPKFVPTQIGAESGGGTAGKSECISLAQTRPFEIRTAGQGLRSGRDRGE